MSYLPTFSFDYEVSANEGREDKIELELRDFFLRANPDELDDIRNCLAVTPFNMRDEISEAHGWIFSRPNEAEGHRKPLQVRNSELRNPPSPERAGRPLFGGHWHLYYSPAATDTRRNYCTFLRLSLNPLRFVRHQSIPRPIGSPLLWRAPRLNTQPDGVSAGGEFSLDGEDNWLPDTTPWHVFANPARWPHHLNRYVCGVGEAFTDELRRVIALQGGQLSVREDFRLKKVETAFEFGAVEPTQLVRSLIPLLMEYRADNFEMSEFPVPRTSREQNSISFSMRIRPEVSLRVYAKTNRRIRFEIIHEGMNVRELLDETPRAHGQSGPRRSRPRNAISRCLAALRENAANEMNTLLQFLRTRSRIVPSHISPLSFLVTVASVLNNRELAHTVVSLLSTFGAISSRKMSAELREGLHALTAAGVLEFNRTRRGYEVRPAYRDAVSLLREHETIFLLTTARQRRRPAAQ